MTATTFSTQLTAVRLTNIDYAIDAARLFLRDEQGVVTEVGSTGAVSQGSTIEILFEAPAPGTYDVAIKVDLAGGGTRTLEQRNDVLIVKDDFGS